MQREIQESSLKLSAGYYLEWDPDVLILRRLDGAMVGAFSARGIVMEAVLEAAEEATPQASSTDPQGPMPVRSVLRARFFGHFEMLCNGKVVRLERNGRALAILKYLLANRGRPVSQDHLMGWLWPESNLKKARWSLNSAVYSLRKLLSRCLSSDTAQLVLLEEGYYSLCPTVRVETDVDEFDAHYEQGRCLVNAHQMEEAAPEYERAVELYRGDYLVEDLYEDWTMIERERLAQAYVDILGRLAIHHMEAGQPQEVMRVCYRLLEKDRCHEDSYRLLMRCYARLGLQGRALHHYWLCKEALKQKYGIDPSSETQALHRSILGARSAGLEPAAF